MSPAGFGGIGVLGFGDGNNRMARLADGIEIVGPFNPTGVSKTASRALIFVCDPENIGEPACAKQITENLARRAFRRPVTADDVARLMPFYEAGRVRTAAASIRESSRWWRRFWPARSFSIGRFAAPDGTSRQTASLRSPIWNWLPAFPSSCGIPVRTRNC